MLRVRILERFHRRGLAAACTACGVAIAVGACGSGHPSQHTSGPSAAVASAPTTTAAPAPASPAGRLRIISPRRGAHTAETLTVHVQLTGASTTGSRPFMFVLDGRLTRLGPTRLTFHGLAPGRHRLVVALAVRPSIRASVNFTVPAPAPPATTSAPPPTTPAPAPATTSPPTQAPAPSSGIPQGPNAGDGDGDNHGGPSDGDGNI